MSDLTVNKDKYYSVINANASLTDKVAELEAWKEEATRLLRQVPPDRSWLSQFWIRDVKKLLGDRST